MTPKTKNQLRIFSLHKKLPKLDDKITKWAYEHLVEHIAYRLKRGDASCLSCGHGFKVKDPALASIKCPNCKRKLSIKTTREKLLTQTVWPCTLDVVEDIQVVRHYELKVYQKAGEAPRIFCWEVVQQWISPDRKKDEVFARFIGMGYNASFSGQLEMRKPDGLRSKYDVYPEGVMPGYKVKPVFQRNGFTKDFGFISTYHLFRRLESDSTAETLLKAKQIVLLRKYMQGYSEVQTYWNTIKICLRNNYTISDYTFYFDYIKNLAHYGKDLRNPTLVCPADLKAEHDKYSAMRTRDTQRDWNEAERQRHRNAEAKAKFQKATPEQQQAMYEAAKAIFFDLQFTAGEILVKPLKSIKEFKKEGEIHEHCVFSNAYYAKEKSLVLHALINAVSIETIEINLERMKIEQARGFDNNPTEHHSAIIKLVNRNMAKIRKVYEQSPVNKAA